MRRRRSTRVRAYIHKVPFLVCLDSDGPSVKVIAECERMSSLHKVHRWIERRCSVGTDGRMNDALKPIIGTVSGGKNNWIADEGSKPKGAVETHGDKDWVQLPHWFLRVARENSVRVNGEDAWTLIEA
jgi:hypothetical protein